MKKRELQLEVPGPTDVEFAKAMAGYSPTPLWKKLGYCPGLEAVVLGAPADYRALLQLPAVVTVAWLSVPRAGIAFVHVFAKSATQLAAQLAKLRHQIAPDGVVWISWPKKSAGVPTDITEDTIRRLALPLGFVDVKVCAVDDTWSGLKLMIRRSAR